jgi:hypothetical protein
MTEERFNQEEVLSVLAQVWPDRLDEVADQPLATVPLGDWGDWIWSLGDARYFCRACESLEDLFGFHAPRQDWRSLAKKETTVGDLASFIAARAPKRPIRPVNILGRKCEKAGIFRMLEETTHKLAGTGVRIGPSTPLKEVLRKRQVESLMLRSRLYFCDLGSADGLWHRSWLVGFACYAGLAAIFLSGITGLLILCGRALSYLGLNGDVLEMLAGLPAYFALLLLLLMLTIIPILFIARWAIGMHTGPLNKRIKTYRDLVEALDRQKQNAFD